MTEPSERELLAFAREIARIEHPEMPRRRRGEIRASLLLRPEPSRPLTAWPRALALRPILAVVVILAVLVGVGGTAAADSLPGDPAFGLKRAAEQVEVALAPNDPSRLDTLVTQSDRRLADLETVVASRASAIAVATDEYLAAVARVDSMLSTLAAEAPSAARDAAIARASAASADHLAALRALASRLPTAAQSGIQRAIDAQETVHGKTDNAPGRRGGENPPSPSTGGRPTFAPTPPRGGPPSGAGRP